MRPGVRAFAAQAWDATTQQEVVKELGSKLSWTNALLLAGSAVTAGGIVQKALITPMQAEISSVQSQISSVSYHIGVMEGRIDRMEGDIQDIKQTQTRMERQMMEMNTTINRMERHMMGSNTNEGQERASS